MKGYFGNIEKETLENDNYRKVLFTGPQSQLVVMSLQPGEEIGSEVHELDQFIRIEQGKAKAILDGVEHNMEDDFAVVYSRWYQSQYYQCWRRGIKNIFSLFTPRT